MKFTISLAPQTPPRPQIRFCPGFPTIYKGNRFLFGCLMGDGFHFSSSDSVSGIHAPQCEEPSWITMHMQSSMPLQRRARRTCPQGLFAPDPHNQQGKALLRRGAAETHHERDTISWTRLHVASQLAAHHVCLLAGTSTMGAPRTLTDMVAKLVISDATQNKCRLPWSDSVSHLNHARPWWW